MVACNPINANISDEKYVNNIKKAWTIINAKFTPSKKEKMD